MSVAAELPAGLGGVDAFRVLGLPYSPDLTDAEVRAAYLLRLRAVHPDNGGDATAAAAVTAAYDALRTGVRRGELLTMVTIDGDPAPDDGMSRGWRRLSQVRERAGSPPRSGPDGEARPGTGRVPDAARREELWQKMAAARVAAGLPPYITDEATLDKIADLLVATLGPDAASAPDKPPPVDAEAPRQRAGQPPTRGLAPTGWLLRVRYGRPWWLAARIVLAALVVLVAQLGAPGDPAVWALGTGAVTWLVRSAGLDLAPRPRR